MKTFSVKFWVKPCRNKNETGKGNIYVRIIINGIRSEISVNRRIDLDRWDPVKEIPKGKGLREEELKRFLRTVEDRLNRNERELIDKGYEVTPINMRKAYQDELEPQHLLLELFDKHNVEFAELVQAGVRSNGTLSRYVATRNHLSAFIMHKYSIKDICLENIKFSFVTDFDFYLRTQAVLANNTVIKRIQSLRKIINKAILDDLIIKDPFKKYTGKLEDRRREFLWPEELEKIEHKTIQNERLDLVKDLFLFACYTGYSYIDIKHFTPKSVQIDEKGRSWIFTDRKKTGIKSDVPLLPPAMRIIKKYKNHPVKIKRGTLLPVYSNQKLNNYLKELADICGIEKNISFGVARHTFGTSITLLNGVSIESTSAMLGHTSTKQTRHYARILNMKVGKEMDVLFEKFE